MSCNGCRVLRKGCSQNCILRPCLQWLQTPEAQSNATVFVAKFFGRAGLMAFISAVPDHQRQSVGRTVNPVNGAVGLLWTGNWHVCQESVETILRGGTLRPVTEISNGGYSSEVLDLSLMQRIESPSMFSEDSVITTCLNAGLRDVEFNKNNNGNDDDDFNTGEGEVQILNLFN
ncbi:LOB domain-containing protein 38-like isoform X2 [Rutidosis leptorrhynchoides]|uniref:LOB domain-containing protein 38-like isoform X2 n=1 Tax=Rutidosis leptorrhynchoides TaxID=125765 RepID=UPI003A995E08